MTTKPVALPPQLHACVNDFLKHANQMQRAYPSNAVSASLLYAAARFNVHGYTELEDDAKTDRAGFVEYMTDLYRRMLEEQIDVVAAEKAGGAK